MAEGGNRKIVLIFKKKNKLDSGNNRVVNGLIQQQNS